MNGKKSKHCSRCGNHFGTYNDSELCESCHLEDVTQGNPPEEGDFNTAAIRAGSMSPQERAAFNDELRGVELGISGYTRTTSLYDPDERDGEFNPNIDWGDVDWADDGRLEPVWNDIPAELNQHEES